MTLSSSRYLRVRRGVRYSANVRGTRAYLAGLGTAGSIVVGAALVFVLASAIVAFRGWPRADGIDSPARIVLRAPASRSETPIARRLVALVARPGPGVARVARRTAGPAVVPARRSVVVVGTGDGGSGSGVSPIARPSPPGRGAPTHRPTPPPTTTPGRTTTSPAPPTNTPASPTTTPASPTAAPAPPTPAPAPPTTTPAPPTTTPPPPTGDGGTSGPVATVVNKVTGTVGTTVSQTGSGVGSVVKSVTAPVGGPIAGVGSGAGDTITRITGTVGAVLSGG
jgi:hypothetical protein